MLGFGLSLIVVICLSIFCVYLSNVKFIMPHRRKRSVIYQVESHKNYGNPHLKSNARPMNSNSWSTGITGHA
jgi:hypothetical protein